MDTTTIIITAVSACIGSGIGIVGLASRSLGRLRDDLGKDMDRRFEAMAETNQKDHDAIGERIGKLDDRVGKLDERIGKLEEKLDDRVGKLDDRVGKLDERVTKLGDHVLRMAGDVGLVKGLLVKKIDLSSNDDDRTD